jgi:hypothetical protein
MRVARRWGRPSIRWTAPLLVWRRSLGSAKYQSGAVVRRYIHGDGADEPVASYEGAGLTTRYYLHADERGSVVAVSDAKRPVRLSLRGVFDPQPTPHAARCAAWSRPPPRGLPVKRRADARRLLLR